MRAVTQRRGSVFVRFVHGTELAEQKRHRAGSSAWGDGVRGSELSFNHESSAVYDSLKRRTAKLTYHQGVKHDDDDFVCGHRNESVAQNGDLTIFLSRSDVER